MRHFNANVSISLFFLLNFSVIHIPFEWITSVVVELLQWFTFSFIMYLLYLFRSVSLLLFWIAGPDDVKWEVSRLLHLFAVVYTACNYVRTVCILCRRDYTSSRERRDTKVTYVPRRAVLAVAFLASLSPDPPCSPFFHLIVSSLTDAHEVLR